MNTSAEWTQSIYLLFEPVKMNSSGALGKGQVRQGTQQKPHDRTLLAIWSGYTPLLSESPEIPEDRRSCSLFARYIVTTSLGV